MDDLAAYKQPIQHELDQVFEAFRAELPDDISYINQTVFRILQEYCTRPGSRVRGSLAAYVGAQLGSPIQVATQLGAIMELLHCYLLLIDDVMDQSHLRRGRPTVQTILHDDHAMTSFNADMVAINGGLIVQHMTSWAVSQLDISANNIRLIMTRLHRNLAITGMGQIDDMSHPDVVSTEAIKRRYYHKSAYYTFINPLECAFSLSGMYNEEAGEAVMSYGLPAGLAYQLRDDYLGIFGDEAKTGKANYDDIREGKYTLLVHDAFETATPDDIAQLTAIIGSEDADSADVATVRGIFRRSGAERRSREAIRASVQDALDAAARYEKIWNQDVRRVLEELIGTLRIETDTYE